MRIWGEPCLHDEQHPYIMSPMSVGLENATISSLKSIEGNGWDYDILRDLFNERDIKLISHIPLSATSRNYCWQWILERRRVYSVKNAYRYFMSSSTLLSVYVNPSVWNNIWALQIPPKVRNLVWRACSSSLPTKIALRTKHVDIAETCPMCNAEMEDTLHVFVKCPYARSVWC